MARATNKVAVHFTKDGHAHVLSLNDCMDILNALVRTNQLELWLDECDQLDGYDSAVLRLAYAFDCGKCRGDQVIALQCDAGDFLQGSPRGCSEEGE